MNTHAKIIRAGIAAVVALVLVGMLFAPVAAEDPQSVGPHYAGTYVNDSLTDLKYTYNSETKTLELEPKVISNTNAYFYPGEIISVAPEWGFVDADVLKINVASGVNLSNVSTRFAAFTNTSLVFNYLGEKVPAGAFGSRTLYKLNISASRIYVDNMSYVAGQPEQYKNFTSGTAFGIDTIWGFENDVIKIAVSPAPGYGVYDWYVCKGDVFDVANVVDAAGYIKKSADPNDGATTYNFTIKAGDGTNYFVEPKLRDSGSTIVSYVFLDADTYVMQIPVDFAMKRVGTPVNNMTVNITSCDLQSNHNLNVTLNSEGDFHANLEGKFTNVFALSNVNDPTKKAGYTIEMKKNYTTTPQATFTALTGNGATVLDTSEILSAGSDEARKKAIEGQVTNGTLKTELQFTLKGVVDTSQLGKYKDKVTFIVNINDRT